MSDPHLIPDQPASPPAFDESTQHQTSVGLARDGKPPEELRPQCLVKLVAGSRVVANPDLVQQLRDRLRVIAVIGVVALLLFLVRNAAVGTGVSLPPPVPVAAAALGLGMSILLWTGRALSLESLRRLELALFGTLSAVLAAHQYARLAGSGEHSGTPWNYDHVAESGVLPFVVLMVGYATAVPNTWRRSVLVLSVISLLPLAATAAGLGQAAAPTELLLRVLLDMVLWLGLAGTLAVYGSHHLDELREEALAARRLGQYRLGRPLGAGGMGEVFFAEHEFLRRPCAIKVIRPDQVQPRNLARFEREVRVMATLTHWNTVEVFDFGHAADGTFYYVMEYLPGITLHELVRTFGPVPPGRAVYLLRQVCAALREAHGIGLIHRDVKPGNIIVCERGGLPDVIKLLDFGLVSLELPDIDGADGRARPADGEPTPRGERITAEGSVVGTPSFLSPEQAAGGRVDARADIYGVGAVAYFLLTGEPPFVRETVMRVLAAHMLEPVVPPGQRRPGLPPDLQAVVLRCLEKDPANRFQDADTLEQALGKCDCARDWGRARAELWWREHRREATAPAQG